MRLLVQDHTGHTTYAEPATVKDGEVAMPVEEMRAKFNELIRTGYFASAGTLADAVQVKSWDDAVKADEILLLGPQQGG